MEKPLKYQKKAWIKQNMEQKQNPYNRNNGKQRIYNKNATALELTAAYLTRELKCILRVPTIHLRW